MEQTIPTTELTAHNLRALRILHVPEYTTVQRNLIITPFTGFLIFNTTTNGYEFYDGANWVSIAPPAVNYWQRAGIIVSPTTAGDSVSLGTGILKNTAYASLIDANAKFQPVEILGTNLPVSTGLFPTGIYLCGTNASGAIQANSSMLSFYVANTKILDFGNVTGANYWGAKNETGQYYFYVTPTNGSPPTWKMYCTLSMQNYHITMTAGYTVDGLDLSEYITAWQANIILMTMEAAGYTNCIAGDIGKVVTDDGTAMGVLCDYNNTTKVWTICSYSFAQPTAASAFAITAGTGIGTTVAAAPTRAPTRQQNIKTINLPTMQLDGAGALTVYLTADGLSTGTALFLKRPSIHISPYTATQPTKAISADFKTITIAAGGAADFVDITVIGAVF